MKKLLGTLVVIAVCLPTLLVILNHQVFAEDISSIGIATYMQVTGNVEDGDIITSTTKGYAPSITAYDAQIVGVIAKKPAIALRVDTQPAGVPVVNVGTVDVKVSAASGPIKKGDYVTTSGAKGVGMKATKSGYIVGQALADAVFAKGAKTTLVPINLNLHFAQIGSPTNSITDILNVTRLAANQEPVSVFKYVLSAVILIVSFSFGFFVFSRAINTGIEALGRNPLAGRMIQLSILFNVVLVIIILLSGFGIVWLFLRL